jgi:hypothetical protein
MLSIYRARVFNKCSTLSEVYMPISGPIFSTSTELIPVILACYIIDKILHPRSKTN